MARTQEDRKAETRAKLLEAAADLFARKGFHAVSAEAVADAADRTTGALYSHFGNKEGLLLALLESWHAETVTEIEAELDAEPDVDGRLLALWRRFVGPDGPPDDDPDVIAAAERDEAMALLEHELWLYTARTPEVADRLAARYAEDRQQLGRGLTHFAGAEHQHLAGPVDEEAVLALGLLLGLAMQHRLDPAAVPPRLVVKGLRRLLGLEPPTDRTRGRARSSRRR